MGKNRKVRIQKVSSLLRKNLTRLWMLFLPVQGRILHRLQLNPVFQQSAKCLKCKAAGGVTSAVSMSSFKTWDCIWISPLSDIN